MRNINSSAAPTFRSGAVARMVGLPVSTLRIWERRYRVVAPPVTATGHRLYSGDDVERLVLIKQLVDQGHAIGSLAALATPALLQVTEARAALRHGPHGTGPVAAGVPVARPRTVLLGLGLARRLGDRALQRVATWADLGSAEAQCAGDDAAGEPLAADLLVADLPTLHTDAARRLVALMQALGVRRSVVVYGFGTAAAAELLRETGCQPRSAPVPDAELRALVDDAAHLLAGAPAVEPPALPAEVPPRLFDDEALAQLAAQSGTVACECPRHMTDLVRLLGKFETYSRECVARNPADGALHAHLQRVAGSARALFESALLRVAEVDGLNLPPGLRVDRQTGLQSA